MKKAILVHGWEGSPEKDWFPWVIEELKNKGWEVVAPVMPNPEAPEIEAWVKHLAGAAGKIDGDTFFIGHSIGCQAIMRFLERQDARVGGAVFVAGWFNLINLENEESEEVARPWIKTPIDLGRVKANLEYSAAILGSNDPWVPLDETKEKFESELGAEVLVIKDGGHITDYDGFDQLPQLIEILTKI